MNKLLSFLTALLLGLPLAGQANDSSFGGSGSLPMPIKQANVKMVSEKIVMRAYGLDKRTLDGEWRVSCNFTFKNTSNSTLKIKMGFPLPLVEETGESSVPAGRHDKIGSPLVHDFSVAVNGKAVNVSRSKINDNEKYGIYYKDAYLWQATFLPHETVNITHRYITGVSADAMGFTWVRYVLQTGRMWQGGSIGHSVIEVIPGVPTRLCTEVNKPYQYMMTKPKGLKIIGKGKNRKYVWNLHNFTPKSDLTLCLQTGQQFIQAKIIYPITGDRMDLNNLPIAKLRLLRNSIYASHGRRFSDPSLQNYFNQQWWYIPNPNYSDRMLNVADKTAIKMIMKAEKRGN